VKNKRKPCVVCGKPTRRRLLDVAMPTWCFGRRRFPICKMHALPLALVAVGARPCPKA